MKFGASPLAEQDNAKTMRALESKLLLDRREHGLVSSFVGVNAPYEASPSRATVAVQPWLYLRDHILFRSLALLTSYLSHAG